MGTRNPSRPTLLVVIPWSPDEPAGVSIVVRNLARELRDGLLKPLIVIDDWKAPVSRKVEGDWDAFRFAISGPMSGLSLIKAIAMAPSRLYRTWRLLRQYHVAAANFHYPSLGALGVAILKRMRLFDGRLVLSFHGTDVRLPAAMLEKAAWRFALGQASCLTAPSRALAMRIEECFAVPAARIRAIPNGVDTTLFCPAARDRSLGDMQLPTRFIISIGQYIPRKDHMTLLRAFASIATRYPDLRLVIVGKAGHELLALQSEAGRMGLADRMTCFVDMPPSFVATATANAVMCVQPSTAEPFGIAVLEAAASGIPVVASRVDGHAEILREGETALLFGPGDVNGCAAAMCEVLEQPEAAQGMAQRFRQEVASRYSWAQCATQYLRAATEGTNR